MISKIPFIKLLRYIPLFLLIKKEEVNQICFSKVPMLEIASDLRL